MSPHFYRVVKEVYGYKNVKAFYSGFPSWQKTGLPVYTEPEFLKLLMDEKGAYVLVDLRSPEKASKEHIPGAVNYPMDELNDLFQDLPDDKKITRIIYYSDNEVDAQRAQRTMRINGYDRGYILSGGIQAWKANNYPTAKGALADEINYKYSYLPGVVDDVEFKEVVAGKHADKVILDVRDPSEVYKSMIKDSINIPIDTLDNRWSELPTDKEYLVICSGGNRARMGYMILKDQGYKVRYLDAKVKLKKDGTLKSVKMRKN